VPSRQFEQHDFSVGEISPDHQWRSELQIRARSARSLRNMRLLVGGAAKSRPGTVRIDDVGGDGQIVSVSIASQTFKLVFGVGTLKIYDKATRTLVTDFAGMSWNQLAIVQGLVVSPHGSKTFVFHQTRRPQVIERARDGTWSVSDYEFGSGIGGATSQPFYRFADPGVTLTPSALTGSITLTASAAAFTGLLAGIRLRIQGREVILGTPTSATSSPATVVQQLYPTKTLEVASSTGFEVGEVITGKDSTARGEVTAIPDATHITVLMQTFTDFFFSGSGEKVIGANAVTDTTAAPVSAANAAVLDWTEQAMSDIRGWPGCGVVHRGRLIMGRLELIPHAIVASAVGDFTDCEVGTNDNDAIFEELGDENIGIVQHFVSAEQFLVLTSRQVFYYPESEANPINPSGFQLLRVGPPGSSACKPAVIAEGVLAAGPGGGSVYGVFPTGDVRRSWRQADISRLSAHMIKHPRCITYVSGHDDEDPDDDEVENKPLNYAYAVKQSGSLAVVAYSETDADAIPGWTPWDTAGEFRWLAAEEGECWAIVKRTYATSPTTRYTLEVFEDARLVDCAVDIDRVADLQGSASGETIQTPAGPQVADFVYRCAELAGATVSLTIGGDYIGEVTLDSDGDFGAPDIEGDIVLGFGFEAEITPWAPMDTEDQRARRRKRRISGALVRYQGKGIAVNGKLRPLYNGGEDTAASAPERDELWRWPIFGWSQEPTVTISKPYAAPLTIFGYSLEVAT